MRELRPLERLRKGTGDRLVDNQDFGDVIGTHLGQKGSVRNGDLGSCSWPPDQKVPHHYEQHEEPTQPKAPQRWILGRVWKFLLPRRHQSSRREERRASLNVASMFSFILTRLFLP